MGDESDRADADGPRLIYLVKQLEMGIRARLDGVLRKHGVTVPQYTALTVLEQHPELSAAQLARHSFVTPQAMEGVVRALEEAGFIERHRDPANRRRLVISVTERAHAFLGECHADVSRIEEAAFGQLSPAEQAGLAVWLTEGRRALTELGGDS